MKRLLLIFHPETLDGNSDLFIWEKGRFRMKIIESGMEGSLI